ncbi:unnamed protein product [Spirodela intermedia]|uniref:Uncharacterized protein n=2 Tax=Spirodela intermedia TaxID=51605 RepID=A0A7I8JRW1_SPIIN|nr:unnamed protein product [Spirodela intermedia]CAA6672303.1 unnamed protein product [Spirodela intermedia]CAA7409484.1 unnamed protein product [Spirodela intermedia]
MYTSIGNLTSTSEKSIILSSSGGPITGSDCPSRRPVGSIRHPSRLLHLDGLRRIGPLLPHHLQHLHLLPRVERVGAPSDGIRQPVDPHLEFIVLPLDPPPVLDEIRPPLVLRGVALHVEVAVWISGLDIVLPAEGDPDGSETCGLRHGLEGEKSAAVVGDVASELLHRRRLLFWVGGGDEDVDAGEVGAAGGVRRRRRVELVPEHGKIGGPVDGTELGDLLADDGHAPEPEGLLVGMLHPADDGGGHGDLAGERLPLLVHGLRRRPTEVAVVFSGAGAAVAVVLGPEGVAVAVGSLGLEQPPVVVELSRLAPHQKRLVGGLHNRHSAVRLLARRRRQRQRRPGGELRRVAVVVLPHLVRLLASRAHPPSLLRVHITIPAYLEPAHADHHCRSTSPVPEKTTSGKNQT